MARKKKVQEVIETNEIKENEVTNTNDFNETNLTTQQNPTKTNTNEEQKVTKGIVIAKGGLRVREKQSLDSNILDVLPYNTEVDVLEEFDEWVKIEQGYLYKKFVEINK